MTSRIEDYEESKVRVTLQNIRETVHHLMESEDPRASTGDHVHNLRYWIHEWMKLNPIKKAGR